MILISILLLLGIALGNSTKNRHGQFGSVLATFAIYISLPALVLKHLHSVPLNVDVAMPAIAPFLVFIIVFIVVLILWRTNRIQMKTAGCLILVCGTGNASIVGIPLIQAYYGSEATGYSVVFDQANFIVMSILGLITASYFASDKSSKSTILKTIITYPPMIATIIALLLRPVIFPVWVEDSLSALAATLTPVAIVSVGANLKLKEIAAQWSIITISLLGKLIMVPLFVLIVFYPFATGIDPLAFKVSILQSGMPPMIVAGMIAVEKKLDPPLAIALISIGIPISFATIFLVTLIL